jgi:hypothetical protein
LPPFKARPPSRLHREGSPPWVRYCVRDALLFARAWLGPTFEVRIPGHAQFQAFHSAS